MLFKPARLGGAALDPDALAADKKNCKKFGPCGVGEKALYLNSFYIDRRYYITYPAVTRVFKRVAMSQGGFSQKGIFASIPYLVVEYDGGRQKQCNFKYEEQVGPDAGLHRPGPPRDQAGQRRGGRAPGPAGAGAGRPQKARAVPRGAALHPRAAGRGPAYLDQKPELAQELSKAARRKRSYQCSKPSYRWVALAITVLGLASLLFGIAHHPAGDRQFRHLLCPVRAGGHLHVLGGQRPAHCPQQQKSHHGAGRQGPAGHGRVSERVRRGRSPCRPATPTPSSSNGCSG